MQRVERSRSGQLRDLCREVNGRRVELYQREPANVLREGRAAIRERSSFEETGKAALHFDHGVPSADQIGIRA